MQGVCLLKVKKLSVLLIFLILLGITWNYFHPNYKITGQYRTESGTCSELTIQITIPHPYSEQRLARLKNIVLAEHKKINYDLNTDIYYIRFYLSASDSVPFREYRIDN
jgi:hypothetical protein